MYFNWITTYMRTGPCPLHLLWSNIPKMYMIIPSPTYNLMFVQVVHTKYSIRMSCTITIYRHKFLSYLASFVVKYINYCFFRSHRKRSSLGIVVHALKLTLRKIYSFNHIPARSMPLNYGTFYVHTYQRVLSSLESFYFRSPSSCCYRQFFSSCTAVECFN